MPLGPLPRGGTLDAMEGDQPTKAGERRLLGLVSVALLAAFLPTLVTFPDVWVRSYQEQGFVVAGLVAWMIWRDRGLVRRAGTAGVPALLPVVALLSVAWLLAVIMNLAVVHQLLFVAALTAWALATFGWGARVPVFSAAVTFLLAIPFWDVANPVLQRATTIMSGSMAWLAGVSAIIQGDTITIESGTFLIEAGCSGINYLMAGLVLGAVYAHVFTRRWSTQLAIVAVAGAAAIVGNWIRVWVLVMIGDAWGIESPWIEDHLWQGWAIFVALMVPTYFVVRVLERRDEPRRYGVGAQPSTSIDPARPRRAATAAGFAAIGPVLYLGVGGLPSGELDRTTGALGVAEALSVVERGSGSADWMPSFQGIDERLQWTVTLPEGEVEAGRYLFIDQRQGEELIQWNNVLTPDSLRVSERVTGPVGHDRRYVREAIFWSPDGPRVAWYWYRVAGVDTPFPTNAKLLELVAFFTRSPASELVVLSARCSPEDCADAAAALRLAVEGRPGT